MISNNLFNHLERNCFRCYPGIIAGKNDNSREITTLLISIGARLRDTVLNLITSHSYITYISFLGNSLFGPKQYVIHLF